MIMIASANNLDNGEGDDEDNISNFTHHWSVHVPECSFLTVENFPLNFVSFLVHPEGEKRARSVFQHKYHLLTSSHV